MTKAITSTAKFAAFHLLLSRRDAHYERIGDTTFAAKELGL